MKNVHNFFGVIAVVIAILFSMFGCDDGTNENQNETTYTINYDVGDGSGTAPSSQTVSSGTTIYLPGQSSMTAPSGRNFTGWRSGGQNYSIGDSYTVSNNTTFVAQWGTGSSGGGTQVPNAPTGVTATALSSGSVQISWSAVSGATGYRVQFSTTSGSSWIFLGGSDNTPVTGTSLSSYLPVPGNLIRVIAVNSAGDSNPSTAVTVTSQSGGVTVPNAPTGVTATRVSASDVYITWNSVSGATSYRIFWSYTSSGTFSFAGTTSSTNYTDSGWGASETGYIRVSAVNSAGEGPQSSSVSFPAFSGGGGSVPNAPTGVTATASSSGDVQISWNPVSGATGYRVQWAISSSGTWGFLGGTNTFPITATSLTSSVPAVGEFVRVIAVNSSGDSNPSTAVIVTSSSGGGTAVPSAPTGVSATRNPAGSTTVTVSWNAVSGATSYKIYYSSTNTGSGSLDGTSTTTSFTSTGNSTDSTWYFRVSAVNNAGEGSPSSWVSVGPVSGGGGTNGAVTIINNSTRTIRNFTLYQSGYNLIYGTGIYFYNATIEPGASSTWTNAPPGSYVRIGSETYLGYKVDKNTSFTVTAGQTTTVTINSSDVVAN